MNQSPEDIVELLKDLYKQATVERSHYYTGKIVKLAIKEIETLRATIKKLEDNFNRNGIYINIKPPENNDYRKG